MLCKNCGTEFEGKFCPECGKPYLQETETLSNTSMDVMDDNSSEIEYASSSNQNISRQNVKNNKLSRPYIEKHLSGLAFAKGAIALFIAIVLGVLIYVIGIFSSSFEEGQGLTISGITAVVLGFLGVALFVAVGVSQFEKLTRNENIKILIPFVLCFAGPVGLFALPCLVFNLLALGLRTIRQRLNKDKTISNDYTILCNYNCILVDIVGLILLMTAGILLLVEGIRFDLDENMYTILIKIFGGIVFALSIIVTILIAVKIVIEFVKLNEKNSKLSEVEINAVEGVIATNKKCYKKLVAMTIIMSMVMAVVIPISSVSLDKFTRCKYIDLSLGIEEVEKHLGFPDVAENGVYEYYSDNYLKLARQIEELEEETFFAQTVADDFDEDDFDDILDDIDKEFGELDKKLKKIEKLKEQLNNLKYKYIRVEFNIRDENNDSYNSEPSYSKIKSIYYDSKKCNTGAASKKQVANIKIDGNTTVSQYETIDIKYTVNYKDNSLYMGRFSGLATVVGEDMVNLPLKINVVELKTLTSDIVKNMLSLYPNDKKSFIVPEAVEVIESEAFYNTSIETIAIGENIKHIQKNAIGSSVSSILYSGTKAEWKKVKKDKSWYSGYDEIVIICSDGSF